MKAARRRSERINDVMIAFDAALLGAHDGSRCAFDPVICGRSLAVGGRTTAKRHVSFTELHARRRRCNAIYPGV